MKGKMMRGGDRRQHSDNCSCCHSRQERRRVTHSLRQRERRQWTKDRW